MPLTYKCAECGVKLCDYCTGKSVPAGTHCECKHEVTCLFFMKPDGAITVETIKTRKKTAGR